MTQRFAVAAMGQDRPGIVAAVSGVLLQLGGNVEDVATSILRGHFAMTLIVAGPDQLDLAKVEGALQPLRGADLAISAWEVHGRLDSAEATHVLSVYGPDHTGIVHAVAQALADSGANICDMVCRLHEGDPAVYVVTVEVALPEGLSADDARAAVERAVRPMGLETTVRSVERSDL
jgi:glycine cleavage system transcriptional repressor